MALTIKWHDKTVRVGFRTYIQTDNTAVRIFNEEGTPFHMASINVAEKHPADIVVLKIEGELGWASNAMLTQSLLDAGIVESVKQVNVNGESGLMCRILKREG